MRKFLLLVTLLLSGLALEAQTAREFKTAADSLRARLRRRTTVDASLKLNRVTKRGTTLDFTFSKELGDYPWREEDVEWFREELLEQWTRFQKWPDILRPNPETYRQIIELVNNA